jgi:molybdenum cofactor cytidylyltransferase
MPETRRAAGFCGVLLAAGSGSRFDATGGRSKLLEPTPHGRHTGAPLAAAAARNLRAVLPRVIAVVRRDTDEAQRRLHALLVDAGCELAVNERAHEGMGTSIARGVAAAPDADGWLIALADMPDIAPSTIEAVRAALAAGAPAAAPWYGGRRGHPVGFCAALRAALLALQGDLGARTVLEAHPPRHIEVGDRGCLLDLDSPADFRAAGR